MRSREEHRKNKKLKGVRIPLPKQIGGLHNPKNAYKRRPRSARRDEFSEDYGGSTATDASLDRKV